MSQISLDLEQRDILSRKEDRSLVNCVKRFGLSFKHLDELEAFRLSLKLRHGNIAQALSVRRTLHDKKATYNHKKLTPEMLGQYPQKSMLQIARKAEVPPLNVARQFLKACGIYKLTEVIHQILNGSSGLSFEQDIIECFFNDDHTNPFVQRERLEDAKAFEQRVHRYLEIKHIDVVTEDKIRENFKHNKTCIQTELLKVLPKYRIVKTVCSFLGKPKLVTPDFLLANPIQLNGSGILIKWIECKNFYGASKHAFANPHMKAMKKQIKKYEKAYGPGAIFFCLGFVDTLPRDLECQCIDASVIDRSFREQHKNK